MPPHRPVACPSPVALRGHYDNITSRTGRGLRSAAKGRVALPRHTARFLRTGRAINFRLDTRKLSKILALASSNPEDRRMEKTERHMHPGMPKFSAHVLDRMWASEEKEPIPDDWRRRHLEDTEFDLPLGATWEDLNEVLAKHNTELELQDEEEEEE